MDVFFQLKRVCIMFIAIVLFLTGSLLAGSKPTYAAVPKLEQIRVALFIDSTRYSSLKSVVTLSATNGLDIGIRDQAGAANWKSHSGPLTVRGSIDQYSVLMLETVDFTAALALYGKLNVLPKDGYVLSHMKQGKTFYEVYYGSFSTAAAAQAAGELAKSNAGVAALIRSSLPQISGPYYMNAGSYSTEAEAAKQVGALSQAGLRADLVTHQDTAGKLVYSAWVGGVSSQEKLNQTKQQVTQLFPQMNLQQVNTATPYLVNKTDVTAAALTLQSVPHYKVGGADTKAWFQPKLGAISVKERTERSYRGGMELSSYNGSLALVNELPLEQYLYAVVSSELGASWPIEALKAQAVAARTYALKQGMKYEIAQLTDTTLDQAYYGIDKEFEAARQAVDATNGEVIMDASGQLITPVYGSNAGGKTADPIEVWGYEQAYLRSVPSPDEGAAAGKELWYAVQLDNGQEGYVHSMYLKKNGKMSPTGFPYYEATDSAINVRMAPYVDNASNPAIAQLNAKQQVIVTGEQVESNAYSWIRIYSASYLETSLAASGTQLSRPLKTLEITKRGPSGRVIEMKANDQIVKVSYPDGFRSALGGLPSTRFEIEQSEGYTRKGTAGGTSSLGEGDMIYVLGAGQAAPSAIHKSKVSVISGSGVIQPLPQEQTQAPGSPVGVNDKNQFVFKGNGFGHGLGMSQWGAKGYAELGYDYKKILQAYYYGVNITKE